MLNSFNQQRVLDVIKHICDCTQRYSKEMCRSWPIQCMYLNKVLSSCKFLKSQIWERVSWSMCLCAKGRKIKNTYQAFSHTQIKSHKKMWNETGQKSITAPPVAQVSWQHSGSLMGHLQTLSLVFGRTKRVYIYIYMSAFEKIQVYNTRKFPVHIIFLWSNEKYCISFATLDTRRR